MMKSDQTDNAGTLKYFATTAFLLLLSGSTLGQQIIAPGASTLETEAEAEIRRYSVEMIIFEYTDPSSSGTEIFDPEIPTPEPEEDFYFGDSRLDPVTGFATGATAEDIATASAKPDDSYATDDSDDTGDLLPVFIDEPLESIPTYEQAGLQILGPEDYVLDKEYERLVSLGAYHPLLRTAWVQPTLEKDVAVPIKLRRLGDPPLRLDGTVTLYLSRFLHLVIDIALEEKTPLRIPATEDRLRSDGGQRSRMRFDPAYLTPSTFYRIKEDRIVRNGELRYFDHPRFGVLAKITRVEEAGANENDTDMTVSPNTGVD